MAVVALLGLRPRSAVERYKEELRARGEELEFAKLSAPQTKAILDYHDTLIQLTAGIAERPFHFGALDFECRPTDGFSVPLWARSHPSGNRQYTWEDLTAQLAAPRPNLAALRQHLDAKPPGSRFSPTHPFADAGPAGVLVATRRAAQLTAASAIEHLHRGRLPEALADLDILMILAEPIDPAKVLVDHMIGVAISGLAHSVIWNALQVPGWNDNQLDTLRARVERLEFVSKIPQVVSTERAFVVTAMNFGATNRGGVLLLASGNPNNPATWQTIFLALHNAFLGQADQLYFLQHSQALLDESRAALTQTNLPALRAAGSNAVARINPSGKWLAKWRFPLTQIVSPQWEKALLHVLANETRRITTLTAIALRRHELRHGSLPETLGELSPDLRAPPPVDALGNGPILYQRIDAHRFSLLSPGINSTNENGRGDDITWPAIEKPTDKPLPGAPPATR